MRRALAVVVVMLTVGLAACSGSGGSGDAGEPRRGGTLRVATVGLTTLDPAQADDPTEAAVAEMFFAPLVDLDPRSHEPRPGLAARWHVNDAQTVFTFSLRRGLVFSDGSPITASDAKATLDRVAAKATASPIAPLLERITGYAAAHDTDGVSQLSGVVEKGPRTLEVTLTEPFASLPSVFSYPGLGIVDPEHLATIADDPVGSGPFRYTGRSGTTLELERAGRGAGSARLARIDLVGYASLEEARGAFDDAEIDVLRLGRDDTAPAGKRTRLHTAPYLAIGFYALDLSNPKFADARFRQAIVQAVDASELVDSAYPGGIVASGLLPEGIPGGGIDQCRSRCDFDVKASKELLAEAFPGGVVPAVAVDYDDSPTQKALADALIAQLTAVGIPATPRPHPESDYANFLANGDPEVFRFGVVGDFPSEDPFLSPWFISTAPENVAHVASPDVDAAVQRARKSETPRRRQEAYADAAAGVLATFAVAPVVQFETRLVAPSTVRAVAIDPFGGFDAWAVWKSNHPTTER
ncbi:MAG: ABC transporter substrate-binding protein [Acidimicrobiia bacterium]